MSWKKLEELYKDVEELNRLSGEATRSKVKDILLIETRKLETEITRLRELGAADIVKSPTSATATNLNKCYNVKLTNYAWDQSEKFVKIFLDLTGVQDLPNENIVCNFLKREVTLSVNGLNNRNYTLTLKNLNQPIEPNTSHWKVKKDKIVIFMHKMKENKQWKSLNVEDKVVKKPTEQVDPGADPTDGLMKIMKQMYEDGDDEMKRTIAKAWTEGSDKKPHDA